MGTHPIFESDFDCLTDINSACANANVKERENKTQQNSKGINLRRKNASGKEQISTSSWRQSSNEVACSSRAANARIDCRDG